MLKEVINLIKEKIDNYFSNISSIDEISINLNEENKEKIQNKHWLDINKIQRSKKTETLSR